MKSSGRRLFSKALPAAPLAAAQMPEKWMNMSIPQPRSSPKCGMNTASAAETGEFIERAKKLDAARKYLYENNKGRNGSVYFRKRKNNWTTLDPNITALRSVSDQHKIHMHIAEEEKLNQEHDSWQQSILRMFGLDTKRDRYELF